MRLSKQNRQYSLELGRRFNVISALLRISMLISISVVFLYFILYTKYVPDAYVFVQYAYVDNIDRTLSLASLYNNTIVFDLLIVIGDFFEFYDYAQWLYIISAVTLAVFLVKYTYLLKNYSILPVAIVYFASFFTDLNQMRFNLSSIIIFIVVSKLSKDKYYIVRGLGFLLHIVPFIIYILTYFRNNVARSSAIVLPAILIIVPSGIYGLLFESRMFLYFDADVGAYPKVLLLFFPILAALMLTKRVSEAQVEIIDYAITAFFIGIALFIFNYELTARFFEISFIALCVANVMSERRLPVDVILLVTALTIFGSRIMSGGISGATYVDQYML